MHMNPKPEQALSSIQVVNSNSHEAVNNIWHMTHVAISFNALRLFNRLQSSSDSHSTEPRRAGVHYFTFTNDTCMHPPTARPCKTLAPRRARAAWPTGNCSAEPFFTFRTWVCSCVATTTVQRTDKTGGYPRRVCRVSAVIVHAMTVAILWTVFS